MADALNRDEAIAKLTATGNDPSQPAEVRLEALKSANLLLQTTQAAGPRRVSLDEYSAAQRQPDLAAVLARDIVAGKAQVVDTIVSQAVFDEMSPLTRARLFAAGGKIQG